MPEASTGHALLIPRFAPVDFGSSWWDLSDPGHHEPPDACRGHKALIPVTCALEVLRFSGDTRGESVFFASDDCLPKGGVVNALTTRTGIESHWGVLPGWTNN